jgi:hypothetical protein
MRTPKWATASLTANFLDGQVDGLFAEDVFARGRGVEDHFRSAG